MNAGLRIEPAQYGSPFCVNRSTDQVIRLLRRHTALSRNEIANILGYSRTKVTTILSELIDMGAIEESGSADSNGGRRPRTLDFVADFGYVVGIDMGATSLDIAVADFRGEILGSVCLAITMEIAPDQILETICEHTLELCREHQIATEKILGITLGIPSPVDFETGIVTSTSIMLGWENYPIREKLRQTFPGAAVLIDNEVNLMALGERHAGAGRDYANFIYVKVGTGIGAGIVLNGQIIRGSIGCAGQIGHISVDPHGPVCHCGNVGCLELIAGAPAIAERALQAAMANPDSVLAELAGQKSALTAEDVGIAAKRGDRFANEIIQNSAQEIGKILAPLVTLLNPDAVFIGGRVSNIGSQFLVTIRREVLQLSMPLSTRHLVIDLSTIRSEAGKIGATALALEYVFAVQD